MQIHQISSPTAVFIGEQAISYSLLQQHITQAMQWLRQKLDADEHHIAVALRNPYMHWVCTLALLQLGKSCTTIYTATELPNSEGVFFHAWLVDTTATTAPPQRSIAVQAASLFDNSLSSEPATASTTATSLQLKIASGAQRSFLSSGTTGHPKLITLSAQDLLTRLHCSSIQYGSELHSGSRVITLMGINTIAGFFLTLLTWRRGGSVIIPLPVESNNSQILDLAQSNLILAGPGQLKEILQKTDGVLPNKEQRIIRTGGARLHPLLRDAALKRLGQRVQITYGATEVGVIATCDAKWLDQYPGAAGHVLPHAQVQIVDEQNLVLPENTQGLVRCKVPGMVYAYENLPNSPQFRDGWFYPGDMGTMTAEGFLVITGRSGDVINISGMKLSAAEVESVLLSYPGVDDICLLGVEYQDIDLLVVATVCEKSLDIENFKNYINNLLKNKFSLQIIRVTSLYRNSMGKLPREILRKKISQIINNSTKT